MKPQKMGKRIFRKQNLTEVQLKPEVLFYFVLPVEVWRDLGKQEGRLQSKAEMKLGS